MVTTHCTAIYPSPPTIPTWAIAVNEVSPDTVTVAADPGAGHRRGVIVYCTPSQACDLPLPLAVSNTTTEAVQDFANKMATAGWLTLYPSLPWDPSTQGQGFYVSSLAVQVQNDGVHGATFYETISLWAKHMLDYIAAQYGANRPVVFAGYSRGAWAALAVALQRPTEIVGWISHCLVTLWENIDWAVFGLFNPLFGVNCTGIDFTGTAVSAPALSVPGIIGWSTADGVVGWSGSSSPVSNVAAIIANAQAASLPLTSYQSSEGGASYPNGHIQVAADNNEYASWITSTLNPSYAVSF